MTKNNFNQYKVFSITVFLVLVAFLAGTYVGMSGRSQQNRGEALHMEDSDLASSTVSLDQFWTVWNILSDKFVYTHKNAKIINDQDKVWGAIEGLTSSYGDPYTVFMPPEDAKVFQTDISGNFSGVGMELGMKDSVIVVISPLKGTPSYNAGVKKGDIVYSIDGTSTVGMTIDTAVKLIRGPEGTVVNIKFVREGVKDPIELKIKRAVIDVPTAETEVKGDVFIIRLYNFYALSPEKFRIALRDFTQSGKTRLILDVRGNPGGFLDAAVDMASWFLPLGKTIVSEDFGPKMDPQVYRSKGYDIFNSNLKMVILADEGSASASEILAGALQEQGIAKLVGTRTFGKGSVQELINIPPDASLKVTVARWLTPKGTSISDGGLTPDYEVKITDADVKAGKDPQEAKAIEVLDK